MAVFLYVATFYAYLFFMRVYAQADFTLMRTLTPFNEVEMSVCSELFLDYCILGGMPAVVREFITKGTFEGSLGIQRQLIADSGLLVAMLDEEAQEDRGRTKISASTRGKLLPLPCLTDTTYES